jgi:hypothetical protein
MAQTQGSILAEKREKKDGKIPAVVQNSVVSGSIPGKVVAIPRDVS